MRPIMIALIASALLAGCGGGVRETLGLKRSAPDEFRVVSRPPLSVPPEFSLRPPAPGEEGPAQASTRDQAAALVLGEDNVQQTLEQKQAAQGTAETAVPVVTAHPLATTGDSKFLSNAGAEQASPDIRSVIHQETTAAAIEKEDSSSLWDGWLTSKEAKEPMVDAKGEAERIRANKDEGKPVTEGETPEVKEKTSGSLLGHIFTNE